MTLSNRVAIVTGAAQGLGEAIALRLAREGCQVTLADINLEKTEAAAERIAKEVGVGTLAVQTNVADEQSVANMVAMTVEKFGKLDVMISNAGILRQATSRRCRWRTGSESSMSI